jgi:hypothetical protein
VAAGGYASAYNSTQGAVAIGNSGRTIVHGFVLEEATASANGGRFAQNEINFLNLTPAPPTVTAQPEDQAVTVGQSATLSVSVDASGNWSTAANWIGGTVAYGSNMTAVTAG